MKKLIVSILNLLIILIFNFCDKNTNNHTIKKIYQDTTTINNNVIDIAAIKKDEKDKNRGILIVHLDTLNKIIIGKKIREDMFIEIKIQNSILYYLNHKRNWVPITSIDQHAITRNQIVFQNDQDNYEIIGLKSYKYNSKKTYNIAITNFYGTPYSLIILIDDNLNIQLVAIGGMSFEDNVIDCFVYQGNLESLYRNFYVKVTDVHMLKYFK